MLIPPNGDQFVERLNGSVRGRHRDGPALHQPPIDLSGERALGEFRTTNAAEKTTRAVVHAHR